METTTAKQWERFTGYFTLVSGGSGKNVWAPNFAAVLRLAINDCLLELVRWEKVTEHFPLMLHTASTKSVVITPILTNMGHSLEAALRRMTSVSMEELDSSSTTPLLNMPKGKAKLAIVGMSGRFPEAPNVEAFWDLLYKGLDVVKEVPAKRWNWKTHVTADGKGHNLGGCKWGCWLDYADQFDPKFFNISPKEAPQMDPAQRMALMATYEALEGAGFVADQTSSSQKHRVGVFHGVTSNDYLECNSGQFIDTYFITGGNRGFIPGRINFCFEFCGPSYTNDTACSSSLAAIHLACNSLWRGDCDTAVAGGTNMCINPDGHTGLDKGFFLSRTGNCKPFDDKADGYCRAEGVATVIIKRLDNAIADNDPILGVILGANTNHSAMTDSMTRPHLEAQMDNMQAVLNDANVEARELSYVEMHGTGTQVGDAVEMQSVLGVFAPNESFRPADKPLYVGTVKGNIGHGEGVSGITSLAKVLLMMKHDMVPPHCGIKPGSKINRTFPDLGARNVHIAMEPTAWGRGNTPRRCLINNFSAAGGNTALLLEDAPLREEITEKDPRSSHIVTVSGNVAVSLKSNVQRLIEHLSRPEVETNLAQLSWTSTARRKHHIHRIAVAGSSTADIIEALKKALDAGHGMTRAKSKPKLLYAFTGQGSQYMGMGKQLFNTVPTFKSDIESLDRLCKPLGFPSFKNVITNTQGDVSELPPVVLQLATTALQMALANFLRLLGLVPTAVVGHSLGEYAALYVAGVLSAADTLFLVGRRATLLQENCKRGSHAMLAIKMPVDKLQHLVTRDGSIRFDVACINSPTDTVISGEIEQMQSAQTLIERNSVKSTFLQTPFAFHSAQVEPILDSFIAAASSVTFNKPSIPVICPLTAEICVDEGHFSPQYLARHCREAVNMSEALQVAKKAGELDDNTVTIEVGPQPVVCSMVESTLGSQMATSTILERNRDVWSNMTNLLGSLYRRGQNVDWTTYHAPFAAAHRVMELPAYAWDLKEYWIEYENDWCTYKPFWKNPDVQKTVIKGGADPANVKKTAEPTARNVPTLASSKPHTTTVHKMIKEEIRENGATLIYETDLSRGDTSRVAGGHIVSNVPFTTPSVFADMALILGNYLSESLLTAEKRDNLILDVGGMVADKVLIPHGQGAQPVRAELDVSWVTGSPYTPATAKCRFYSVSNTGQETSGHGWCTLDFVSRPEPEDIRKMMQEAKPKMQRLHESADNGEIVRYNKASGYRLMATVARFAADYKLLDDMILDDVGLEATCCINLATVAPGGSHAAHPAYIDAITQIGGFCVNAQESLDLSTQVFITHGWKSLQIYREMRPDGVYQLYTCMTRNGDEFYIGDTLVFDGPEVIARMKSVSFRKVSKSTHKAVMSTIVSRRQKAGGFNANPAEKPVNRAVPPPKAVAGNQESSMSARSKAEPQPRVTLSSPPATQLDAIPTATPEASLHISSLERRADASNNGKVEEALKIVAEESGISLPELIDDTSFADIGVDSLLSMVIVSRFREELSLALDPDFKLFVDCATVKLMREFVADLTGQASSAPIVDLEVPVEQPVSKSSIIEEPKVGSYAAPAEKKEQRTVHTDSDTSSTNTPVTSAVSHREHTQLIAKVGEESFLGMAEARSSDGALVSAGLAIVSEESGLADSDLTDDTTFADIGVDSLLSIVIASRLREELGLELDAEFSLFLNCPTVRHLKTFLGGKGEARAISSDGTFSDEGWTGVTASTVEYEPCRPATSVILQGLPKNASKTLFLLPDGSGSAFSYVQLPRVKGDIAIIGLNCPYVRSPEKMLCGPTSLIESFVNEISRRQPGGPYHLGGWSCGGAFAFACAEVLISRGESVDSLVFIDAPVPNLIGHLPAEFYEHVGTLGLYGEEEPPVHLIPHFIQTTQTMLPYKPAPLKTASPPIVGILWATETVMKAAGAPEFLKKNDHFLTQARKDFGPDGWDKLVPGGQFLLDKVQGANHFSMMVSR